MIKSLYGSGGGFQNRVGTGLHYGVWESILSCGSVIDKAGIPFPTSFCSKVGDGSEGKFWTDDWASPGVFFKDKYLRLFALKTNPLSSLKDGWLLSCGVGAGNWFWCTTLRGRTMDFFECLSQDMVGVNLVPGSKDGWRWLLDGNEVFTVSNLASLIDNKLLATHGLVDTFKWNNWLPKKINVCFWSRSINPLPFL